MIEANDFLSAIGLGGSAPKTVAQQPTSEIQDTADNGQVLDSFADFLEGGTHATGFEAALSAVVNGTFPSLGPNGIETLTPGTIAPTAEQAAAHFEAFEAERQAAAGNGSGGDIDPRLSVIPLQSSELHALTDFVGSDAGAQPTAAVQQIFGSIKQLDPAMMNSLIASVQAVDTAGAADILGISADGLTAIQSASPLVGGAAQTHLLGDGGTLQFLQQAMKGVQTDAVGEIKPLSGSQLEALTNSATAASKPDSQATLQTVAPSETQSVLGQSTNAAQSGQTSVSQAQAATAASDPAALPRISGDAVAQAAAAEPKAVASESAQASASQNTSAGTSSAGTSGAGTSGAASASAYSANGGGASAGSDHNANSSNQQSSKDGDAHGTGVLGGALPEKKAAADDKADVLPDLTPRDGRGVPHWVLNGTGAATLEGLAGLGVGFGGIAASSGSFGFAGGEAAPGSLEQLTRYFSGNGTSVPVSPAQTASQLNMAIGRAQSSGIDAFTIKLDPVELGRLSVQLKFGADGTASAEIAAANPDTLKLLQSEEKAIEKALTASGHSLGADGISFTLDKDGQNGFGRAFQEARQEALQEETLNQASTEAGSDSGSGAIGTSGEQGPTSGQAGAQRLEDQLAAMGDGDSIDVGAIIGHVTPETGLDIRV